MATEIKSMIRGKPILASSAIMALGVMMMGCQTNSEALMYAREAHAQEVEAWCYANLGARTESLLQQCIKEAWINVPPSECFPDFCPDTGRIRK